MKYFIIIFFFVLSIAGLCQSQEPVYTGSFNNTPAGSALAEIQSSTNLTIYFKKKWIDSLQVTGTFNNTPVSEVLSTIFKGTSIGHYVKGDEVFLIENSIIIDQPPILKTLDRESATAVEKGLVFAREYQQTTDQSKIEEIIHEIGNKAAMDPNSTSTIAGYVKNEENDEPVQGALVYTQNPFKAVSTDENGFYSLTLPNGKHTLLFQSVGMKTTSRKIILFSNGKLNVDMKVDVIALQEVTVESDRDLNVSNVQMGVSKINVEEVKTVPIVLGENDILKIATTKAGVQTVGEGASGFNVRGGKADQNLILINDAPVYNANHFFGFFSVFNSDALQSMDLYKSGINAKYDGRLSSVFDIKGKEANKKEFSGSGGISPITSKLTLEIPLVEDKTGLLIGGRTTYSNWVLSNINNAQFSENRVSFFDILTQVDHIIDENNDLQLSGYISKDRFRLSSDTLFSFSNFGFINANGSAKWNHRFSKDFEGSLSAVYAHYGYDLIYDELASGAYAQNFDMSEATLKTEFDYYINNSHSLSFGFSSKRYWINPGEKTPEGNESIIIAEKVPQENGLESALFLSDQFDVTDNLSIYAGLRYVMFNALGPAEVFSYAEGVPKNNETITGSEDFSQGEVIETYHAPEWRFSARYLIDKTNSIKIGASRIRQYIHTFSNSSSLSPTDTWRLTSKHILPQNADQVSLGYYKNLLGNTLEVSVEGYYKWLDNLVDFKSGSTFLLNKYIERDVLQGPGKSYGIEFSVNKTGRLNGWLNYAYARTFIKLEGDNTEETVNNGAFFPTGYDKPHTFNLVANYKLTRRLSFSLNTTYSTGRPVTFPESGFNFKGSQNIHFGERNAYRIPDYFRIDLGINLEGNHKIEKLSHSFWSLSLYNLTGRDNPYSVFIDIKDGKARGSQLIVFGSIIPTLSYNFKF